MASQNRYVVAPTVTMLAVMRTRLTGAIKGHALLKKKADALTMRFRLATFSLQRDGPDGPAVPKRMSLRRGCKHMIACRCSNSTACVPRQQSLVVAITQGSPAARHAGCCCGSLADYKDCNACRQILKKIVDTKTSMGEVLRAAAFAQTEAKYSAGEYKYTVFDNVDKASVRVNPSRPTAPPKLNDRGRLWSTHPQSHDVIHRRTH